MNIAILGASGAVGMQVLKCLNERNIKIDKLKLLASERSAGKIIKYNGNDVIIEKTTEDSFKGMDVVCGAAENDIAKEFAPHIVKAGAVFVDNSSAFRLEENVPLVVPQINKEDIKKHNGIIANPNCSTIITMMALYPINKLSKIKNVIATTFQAVSGAGVGGIDELYSQISSICEENTKKGYIPKDDGGANIKKDLASKTFKYQIAYNVIPAIGSFKENLYTTEEMKMQNEGRKIMHLPTLNVTCTCVRVPVMRSHCISVSLSTEEKLDLNKVREEITKSAGVKLVDDVANHKYPMPLSTCDKDIVEVGRIREDLVLENGISLFCSGDQIRKGAATNVVEIIEELAK